MSHLKFQADYRCGGFAYGKSAMEHAADGLFDNAAVTKWERGKAAEVLWKSGAGHKGIFSTEFNYFYGFAAASFLK